MGSFRHGFFHDSLIEADILLASGDMVTASAEGQHADLFRALPNSLGAFGCLLRLRLRLQRAMPLVRLDKVWCSSPEGLVEGVIAACGKHDADFVDGVALGDKGGMLITASFVANPPKGCQVQQYGIWPPFYSSVVQEGTEFLRTIDYIWRWDADCFWFTQVFPSLRWRLTRWLCGAELLRSDVYKPFNNAVVNVLETLGLNRDEERIIQDCLLPLDRAAEWIQKFLRVVPSSRIGKIKLTKPGLPTDTAPIWLCPVKGTASSLMPMQADRLYMNFGFWDALEGPETQGGNTVGRINRALEALCTTMGGKKTLSSLCYFLEEEFYQQYNGDAYHRVKQRYDPNGRFRGWFERLTKS